jgi:hypothetical protein
VLPNAILLLVYNVAVAASVDILYLLRLVEQFLLPVKHQSLFSMSPMRLHMVERGCLFMMLLFVLGFFFNCMLLRSVRCYVYGERCCLLLNALIPVLNESVYWRFERSISSVLNGFNLAVTARNMALSLLKSSFAMVLTTLPTQNLSCSNTVLSDLIVCIVCCVIANLQCIQFLSVLVAFSIEKVLWVFKLGFSFADH